jgi:transcriptional regulator with XRE-family HTH domain
VPRDLPAAYMHPAPAPEVRPLAVHTHRARIERIQKPRRYTPPRRDWIRRRGRRSGIRVMTTTASSTFGMLLRRYRVAAALTQEGLAERAGLSARGVQDLERGVRVAPRLDTVRLLADALGLDPEVRAGLIAAARPELAVPATPGLLLPRLPDLPVPPHPWWDVSARSPRRVPCCGVPRFVS